MDRLTESRLQKQDAILQAVVGAVLSSRKYRRVEPGLVRAIAAAELAKGRTHKEAVKATKNRLHQSAGAYFAGPIDYDRWRDELRRLPPGEDTPEARALLRRFMAAHASARERLPWLDRFYAEIFRRLPPVHSIGDVACGLNPLARPWMPLPAAVTYHAWDIYADQIGFLNDFLAWAGIVGRADVRDVLHDCPTEAVDVALVLKTLPCLEQMESGAGEHLLMTLNAPYLVVSFPMHSLGGRPKGMAINYEDYFRRLVADRPWRVERLLFASELVFLVAR